MCAIKSLVEDYLACRYENKIRYCKTWQISLKQKLSKWFNNNFTQKCRLKPKQNSDSTTGPLAQLFELIFLYRECDVTHNCNNPNFPKLEPSLLFERFVRSFISYDYSRISVRGPSRSDKIFEPRENGLEGETKFERFESGNFSTRPDFEPEVLNVDKMRHCVLLVRCGLYFYF